MKKQGQELSLEQRINMCGVNKELVARASEVLGVDQSEIVAELERAFPTRSDASPSFIVGLQRFNYVRQAKANGEFENLIRMRGFALLEEGLNDGIVMVVDGPSRSGFLLPISNGPAVPFGIRNRKYFIHFYRHGQRVKGDNPFTRMCKANNRTATAMKKLIEENGRMCDDQRMWQRVESFPIILDEPVQEDDLVMQTLVRHKIARIVISDTESQLACLV